MDLNEASLPSRVDQRVREEVAEATGQALALLHLLALPLREDGRK